jgi:hypothetical protein
VREFELKMLKDWGERVKVDFLQSDKQDVISLYHDIMKDTAAHQIMVNFHGCTLPRGWDRTFPHLMSMEAVRGEECYIFDSRCPEMAPGQNTILPFTRNAVGPMDYTPMGFSNNRTLTSRLMGTSWRCRSCSKAAGCISPTERKRPELPAARRNSSSMSPWLGMTRVL